MSVPGLPWMPGSRGAIPPLVGLKSWLRADSQVTLVGGKVSAVGDLASPGKIWTQGTDANRMVQTGGGANGNQYWQCGGTEATYIIAPAGLFTGLTEAEFYVVYKKDVAYSSDTLNGGMWKMGADALGSSHIPYGTGQVFDSAGASARYAIGTITAAPAVASYSVRASGSDWQNYRNGANLGSNGSNTFSTGSYQWLGTSILPATVYHKGAIYEFLVYSPILDTTTRAALQSYLSARYSIVFA